MGMGLFRGGSAIMVVDQCGRATCSGAGKHRAEIDEGLFRGRIADLFRVATEPVPMDARRTVEDGGDEDRADRNTVPTGIPGSGSPPARPVVATAASTPSRRLTPVAICDAASSLRTFGALTPSRDRLVAVW